MKIFGFAVLIFHIILVFFGKKIDISVVVGVFSVTIIIFLKNTVKKDFSVNSTFASTTFIKILSFLSISDLFFVISYKIVDAGQFELLFLSFFMTYIVNIIYAIQRNLILSIKDVANVTGEDESD